MFYLYDAVIRASLVKMINCLPNMDNFVF